MTNKFKTYTISVDFISSTSFEIEAESDEEAVEKAQLLAEAAVIEGEFEPGAFNFDIIDINED